MSDKMICGCCGAPLTVAGSFSCFKHALCNKCGHEIFFKDDGINIASDIYETDFDYDADLSISHFHTDLLQWNHVEAVKYLSNRFQGLKPRILDIGCFNGFFVRHLLNLGFEASGIDFNNKAIEFGKSKYQLNGYIANTSIDDLLSRGVLYDIVTMFEVIEHIDEYSRLIQSAAQLIRPGGIIIISTPNSHMLWRPRLDYPPHHLCRFTPLSLNTLIGRFGFEEILHLEQSSIFDLMRNYIGSLFRQPQRASLRGGEFRYLKSVNKLRVIANRSKWFIYRIFIPIDWFAHKMGVRYIGQLIIARKSLS